MSGVSGVKFMRASRTKKGRRFAKLYLWSDFHGLDELYKKHSCAKEAAFRELLEKVPEGRRHTVRVWGNCNLFTFAWTQYSDNIADYLETLCVETACGSYRVLLDWDSRSKASGELQDLRSEWEAECL